MNRKEYEAKRKQLMDEAQAKINSADPQGAQGLMDEIKALDEQWDAIAQAEANFAALNAEPKAMVRVNQESFGVTDERDEPEAVKAWKSEEYKNAWAKQLMGKQLSNVEQDTYKMVNEAFVHTTKNTSAVIPETVSNKIWEMAGEMYPYFADVTKTYVKGVLSLTQEESSTDAGWYDEATKTEDGKETFKTFTLNGCELSRDITVSWKLREMAIEDFINYIQRKMAKKMGAAAGYGVTRGAGPTAAKPEPMGVVTALLAEAGKPQVVEYANGTIPTYENITAARAKIKSGYGAGLSVYADSNTIWNKLANILDKNGRPLFVSDVTSGGLGRILGMVVKEDDSMNGDILFSNASAGYHLNVNKQITMMTEEHVKERNTDYCGYAIMDGNVLTTKAHALLREAAPSETTESGTENGTEEVDTQGE